MKRILFYVFYDEKGIVDDYIVYQINKLREHVDHIVFVVNGLLTPDSRQKINPIVDILFCRKNEGFDVGGHKEALAFVGPEKLNQYDEVVMMNMTCYGPIFPLNEIFDWAESQDVSFWGVSDHDEHRWVTDKHSVLIPRHLQSNFIVARKKMFDTPEFRAYWDKMPLPRSYEETIFNHEATFTTYFASKGHRFSAYVNIDNYGTSYPSFHEVLDTIKNSRSPFVKRRLFFHDPLFIEKNAIRVNKVIPLIKSITDYPVKLIYQNLLRTCKPKDLAVNLDAIKIFDSEGDETLRSFKKIAVLAHVFYPEMIGELLQYTENIPQTYNLYVTTENDVAKISIETYLSDFQAKNNCALNFYEVRVAEQNRGRDIAPLLISLKDVVLENKYDFICRIHAKKTPQIGLLRGEMFKDYLMENVLFSKNYVKKLLNYFDANSHVGMLFPPMIHLAGMPTLGHSWGPNKDGAKDWAYKLGINVPFDDFSPLAAYGSIYWFRPAALESIFQYPFKWEDFPREPIANDGTAAHAIERLLAYAAHNSGYLASNVMTSEWAEVSYSKLEYKTSRIFSHLTDGDVFNQIRNLHLMNQRQSIKALGYLINSRHPRLARILKPFYFLIVKLVRMIR